MKNIPQGTCHWITGLAGSGKTTIGTLLHEYFQNTKGNTVYLDGDILREVMDAKEVYSIDDRRKLAMCYSRFCNMLTQQGLNVICSTISMFHDVREWNREHIHQYFEVYIKVSMDILIKRDQKKLYSSAKNGEKRNVVGVDLAFEEPKSPDLIINNDGSRSPNEWVNLIIEQTVFKG